MSESRLGNFEDCFSELEDPRIVNKCDHSLLEILIIAVCGVLCGGEGWADIEEFGRIKEGWLRKFLVLPNGIPSHDTFGRVFAALNGEVFQRCFIRWVEQIFSISEGQVVAIDGKTLRGSHERGVGKAAIHMISAWATANGIVLGQLKVADKSNEITAIPELLALLDLRGCLVTIDAMGCQKKIVQTICDEQADYLLRVKDNQGKLHQDIDDWFGYGDQVVFANMHVDYAETIHKNHGRIEIRRCWAIDDPLAFDYIRHFEGWINLTSIVRIHRERRFPDHTESETAYYISSLPADASRILEATRQHWTIENSLHWVLDVTFGEDDSRIRTGASPQNMAVLRHIALNLLKRDTSSTSSLRRKRLRAALDEDFLFHLISQI